MATEGEIKAPINANIINASEARNSFAQVLADVDAGRCDFLIKRNNKLIAAIIPASDYTKIVEELISLRAINHALAYSEAYKQGRARTVAWGDLKEKLSKVIEAGETVEDVNVEVAETSE